MHELDASPLLVGLDLGTGRCKAALVTREGQVIHVARRPTATRRLPGGGAVHPVPELLATVETLLAGCASAAAGRRIAGIGIASMSEAGVPLDRSGRPVGDIIAWFDARPSAEAAALASWVGPERLHAITGLRADAKYTLAKLLWLGRHRPASIRRMRAWAGVAELAVRHLSGALATNGSLACRTLAFDVSSRRWDADLLALAGLTIDQVAPILPFAHAAGGLRPEVARRAGLDPGLPVCVAGHDHAVGAFGAGVAWPGQALDSMGSAEPVLVVTERPRLDDSLRLAGLSTGCHVLDDRWYVLAGLQQSGGTVDWFVERLLGGTEADGADPYAAFMRLIASVPPGPTGLIVLPYPRGRSAPHPDPGATLDVLGLRPEHGLADIGVAVLEGTAFAARWMLEALETAAGVRVRRLRVIGGGTRNPRWLEIKAGVGRWPLAVAEAGEATAFGAALIAGIASGTFASPADALRRAAPARTLDAARGVRRRYVRAYEAWVRAADRAADPAVRPMCERRGMKRVQDSPLVTPAEVRHTLRWVVGAAAAFLPGPPGSGAVIRMAVRRPLVSRVPRLSPRPRSRQRSASRWLLIPRPPSGFPTSSWWGVVAPGQDRALRLRSIEPRAAAAAGVPACLPRRRMSGSRSSSARAPGSAG